MPEEKSFEGLKKLKINRQKRHINSLENFAKFLDDLSEELEQKLLDLSRSVREKVALFDGQLRSKYNRLLDDDFMTSLSEDDVSALLTDLKEKNLERSNTIDTFAKDLDGIEIYRADSVSKELKALVDNLISIAHQLPDEIEHIAESESFDLNVVLTSNRKAHAELLAMMRKIQIESEVEALQSWENSKARWRQLRHDKALKDFNKDTISSRFNDPEDRKIFMEEVRKSQSDRQAERIELLTKLASIDVFTIDSETLQNIRQQFSNISEKEILAIQDCYNNLTKFKEVLKLIALDRVEELRKELHEYGALHEEPPMKSISDIFSCSLNNPDLSELWRLGGGLKPEFASLVDDLISSNIVYNDHIIDMEKRIEIIVSSFNLKEVLEERGRLMTLDRVRTLLIKLRSAPKSELPDVINSLLVDLDEIQSVDKMSDVFRHQIKIISGDMRNELDRLANSNSISNLNDESSSSVNENSIMKSNTSASKANRSSVLKSSKSSKSHAGSSSYEIENDKFMDPLSIKSWCKKLGVLYYGCDLPIESQEACKSALSAMRQQIVCNDSIDEVVLSTSSKFLHYLEKKYKVFIDKIANVMETQASSIALCASNMIDFYLNISKAVEKHRALQKTLDEKSMDELWDWKEDFRLFLEEKELEIENQSLLVKKSNNSQELLFQFEKVLNLLDEIQESYRGYHSKACFIADKHPLSLSDEFKCHLNSICDFYQMQTKNPHLILSSYDRLFSDMIRLNKQFLEKNPNVTIVGDNERIINYEFFTKKNQEEKENENPDNSIDTKGIENKETKGLVFPEYTSPLNRYDMHDINSPSAVSTGTSLSSTSSSSYDDMQPGGTYFIKLAISEIVSSFLIEKESVDDINKEESNALEMMSSMNVSSPVKVQVQADFPWLIEDFILLPPEKLKELEGENDEIGGLNEYNETLVKSFVALTENELSLLPPEKVEAYQETLNSVNAAKERIEIIKNPSYIRSKIPLDSSDNPWVISIQLDPDVLDRLLSALRDSCISHLENEAHERTKASEKLCISRKSEFTEELEDRIRTHWPRRGRVETQIKQPREAELISHEEKTWRHIQSIQSRMIEIQTKFNQNLSKAKIFCDDYVRDIMENKSTLLSTTWKNLATLQAVDAKVRNITIEYQAESAKQLRNLQNIVEDEVNSVKTFAFQFIKLCPLQEEGKEGGYSESEISDIQFLIDGQCNEIQLVQEEWNSSVLSIKELQDQTLKSINAFTETYDKTCLELSLAEGLGQKFGAPRRRAQEKLRTEISRDEQSAGKIDEILAKLDFFCSEEQNKSENMPPESLEIESNSPAMISGTKELTNCNIIWDLLSKVRTALLSRVAYLDIKEKDINSAEIPWLVNQKESIILKGDEVIPDDSFRNSLSSGKLKLFYEDMNSVCRNETKQLYQSEGRVDALGPNGIPDSLEKWLNEKQDKLFGPDGYREKAWKRVWAQIDRLELILCRKFFETEEEEEIAANRLGAPAVALRFLNSAYINFLSQECNSMEKKFKKILSLLEKGREKNERLLRPRLGSPDKIDELNKLDLDETTRSKDLTSAVIDFQDMLARKILEISKIYLEDVTICYKGLILYLDSSMRLHHISLPPNYVLPKKKLTLKRLRKAQRIRQEVMSSGNQEDRSQNRTWPSVPVDGLLDLLSETDGIIIEKKSSLPPPEVVPVAVTKGGKPPAKGANPPIPDTVSSSEPPSLIPSSWLTNLAATSCIYGSVSTGHRAIVKERDNLIFKFMSAFKMFLSDSKLYYNNVLQQEKSWNERWNRQVEMLRSGVI